MLIVCVLNAHKTVRPIPQATQAIEGRSLPRVFQDSHVSQILARSMAIQLEPKLDHDKHRCDI